MNQHTISKEILDTQSLLQILVKLESIFVMEDIILFTGWDLAWTELKLSSILLPLLTVFLNLYGELKQEMQLLQITISVLVSIESELKFSLMNSQVETVRKLTMISVISTEVHTLQHLMEVELLLWAELAMDYWLQK